MVSGATDINSEPGCGLATNPDMALGSIPGRDDIMVPGGSTGNSYWFGPGGSIALGCQHGLGLDDTLAPKILQFIHSFNYLP